MIINIKHLSQSIPVLLIGSMLMSSSCEISEKEPAYKSDTLLPPITTVGANTFGCKLNGSYWLALPYKKYEASYSKGAISVVFEKYGDNKRGILIIASLYNTIFETGEYKFNNSIRGTYLEEGIYRTTDSTKFGYLNILRLDTINRIMSGTFEFMSENESLIPNNVYITEGRFDLKY